MTNCVLTGTVGVPRALRWKFTSILLGCFNRNYSNLGLAASRYDPSFQKVVALGSARVWRGFPCTPTHWQPDDGCDSRPDFTVPSPHLQIGFEEFTGFSLGCHLK